MRESYSSLSVAIEDLQRLGYTVDFNLVADGFSSKVLKKDWSPKECTIIKYYRFEGMTDPGDSSILYVIESNSGEKGLLVDNYSAKGSYLSPEMIKKLNISHDE